METVPGPAQDAGQNPNSVKSEDGSSPNGRSSPPPNCAICLGTCRNKSFTDSCLHQFCFKCLLTWSKVKAECPLCKQNFKSIIHNVRSNHQYEEYMVGERSVDINERVASASRTFRYRTTLTLPRHESITIQQLLLQHYPLMANLFPAPPPAHRRRSSNLFRRTVYRHNLWAQPLADFTGRFRECSPQFYRYNVTQMHRLMPWLSRELIFLLNDNQAHISYVMARILELLPQYHINSPEFREIMRRYFGARTEHFLHELYCFASTPFDITGYDRHVQYSTDTRVSTVISELVSSSDSDASGDSDIIVISGPSTPAPAPHQASHQASPSAPAPAPASGSVPEHRAGPSRSARHTRPPTYPLNYIPLSPANGVIPIETISNSDTDDDSEVMVVGYIKPPQDRIPEIVDLVGSDSDVIVQEPEPTNDAETSENRMVPLVKLSLKCHRPSQSRESSESEDSTYTPPRQRRRKRTRTSDTASTTELYCSTPSLPESRSSPSTTASDSSSSSSSSSSSFQADTSDSYESAEEKRKVSKRKLKRKKSSEKSKKKIKRSKFRSTHKENVVSQSKSDKPSKRKSYSGKGVKSSKKNNDSASASKLNLAQLQANIDQPVASTSGSSSDKKHNCDKNQKLYRSSHESKRLKSVVRVIKSKKTVNGPYINGNENSPCDTMEIASASRPQPESPRTPPRPRDVRDRKRLGFSPISSDSEDDLPLNLTIQKSSP